MDIIDRDTPGRPIPWQVAVPERRQEYLGHIMSAFLELKSQEDAKEAFTVPEQDWSDLCEKIVSVTRKVKLVSGRPYGIYICQSREQLTPEEVDSLKRYCREQWELGWGEGYAHSPRKWPCSNCSALA